VGRGIPRVALWGCTAGWFLEPSDLSLRLRSCRSHPGVLQVKYALPYSDLTSLTVEEKQRVIEKGMPLEFSHTLEDQIGGQLDAGLLLTGFFEDAYPEDENDLLTNER